MINKCSNGKSKHYAQMDNVTRDENTKKESKRNPNNHNNYNNNKNTNRKKEGLW